MGREPQVETGQWRKLSTGEPFRVGDAKKIGNTEGRIVHFLDKRTGWQNNTTLASRILATPGEVLDEKLLTLTREQRARVKVCDWGIRVDDVWINGGTAAKSWWMRTDVHTDIDRMLARLDEALSKTAPTPPAQQTEPVRVGQWRKWTTELGKVDVFRIDADSRDGCIFIRYLDGTPATKLAEFWSALATPREVLDAKLATLTPDQRARVTFDIHVEKHETNAVFVDHVCAWGGGFTWWAGTLKIDADAYGIGIDGMLAAIDAALSRPAPVLTRTEAIKAHCAGKPVTIESREGVLGEAQFGLLIDGVFVKKTNWNPNCDSNPNPDHTTEKIIARIDAALAKPAPQECGWCNGSGTSWTGSYCRDEEEWESDPCERCDGSGVEPAPRESTAPEGDAASQPHKSEAGTTGLRINCDQCAELITEPGALFFGPPDAQGRSLKKHICVACLPVRSWLTLSGKDAIDMAITENENARLRSELAAMTAERDALKRWRDGYRQSSEDATNRLTEVLAERDALAALNAELRADVGRMAARVKALEAHMQLVRDLAAIPSKRAVNIFDEVANLTRRIAMRWGHSDGSVTEPEKGTVGTSHE